MGVCKKQVKRITDGATEQAAI